MANDALERVRKRVRRDLDTKTRLKLKNERFILLRRHKDLSAEDKDKLLQWSLQFPELGVAHAAKEAFFEIYDEPTKAAAQKAATAWLERLPDMVAKEFRETSVALRNWWDEIFAWYDYPVSNAYTESVNRLAKDLNRMGRGYSFEVVRARLLLDPEARKPTTKTIRSRSPKPSVYSGNSNSLSMGRMVPSLESDVTEKVIEYGPHIPTICKLLEAGYFE